jgi:hypothetical protein
VTITLYIGEYEPLGKNINHNKKWPSGVNHTYYKFDDAVEWIEYLGPINYSEDGKHTIFFYSEWKDEYVEPENHANFDIDQTAPSISMSVEKVGFRQFKITATASDTTSGMWYVVCYIDDMLLGNISTPGPYIWDWTGKGNHTVTGIAYDYAGNSAENDVVFSYALNEFHHQRFMFLSMIVKIIQRILSHFPMLSELTEMLTTSV